jgi:hypothetical protein
MMADRFVCAICERENKPTVWTRMADRDISPICYRCEVEWTSSGYGYRSRRVGAPKGGTHMDRRMVLRLYALAEALDAAAHQLTWSKQYAAS